MMMDQVEFQQCSQNMEVLRRESKISNVPCPASASEGISLWKIREHSDPFTLRNVSEELERGKYGSVSNDIKEIYLRRDRLKYLCSLMQTPSGFSSTIQMTPDSYTFPALSSKKKEKIESPIIIIDSDEEGESPNLQISSYEPLSDLGSSSTPGLLRINSPSNAPLNSMSSVSQMYSSRLHTESLFQHVVLKNRLDERPTDFSGRNLGQNVGQETEDFINKQRTRVKSIYGVRTPKDVGLVDLPLSTKRARLSNGDLVQSTNGALETNNAHTCDREQSAGDERSVQAEQSEPSSPVGILEDNSMESHLENNECDQYSDIWTEMSLALECSKSNVQENSIKEKGRDECDHSFILMDDLGYVCRVCGVIERRIETIFDYQWIKNTKATKSSTYVAPNIPENLQAEITHFSRPKEFEEDPNVSEVSVHPRHMKQMKPHQLEGFNFLVRNLISDKPGGCILAHAPGSGKTFMIISFIQSFLAKYPHARPLVILPKGILSTWKREFKRWQVEDIPLLDFYSSKADSRAQQLEVLDNWVENRSILFLGYKQFANIVSSNANNNIETACQERLLKVPSLLILDEGHTPRNENTDVLHSLGKVETPRKIVLSGTLFQNHVKEVFNILNLVRPKFLKLENSRSVVRRVLSKVQISGGSRRHCRTGVDTTFFDLVEETLQNEDDLKTKVAVIHDLREMTQNVLHYYKGDFLDELPGLVDFTVLLNLTWKQKDIVGQLKKMEKFKRNSVGSAVYLHPQLKEISENSLGDKAGLISDDKMDNMLEKLNLKDGVKAKFFLSILSLSESAGEKLLVFSQYLLPLKFLERLTVKIMGWRPGKEIFMISGDSSAEHREWSMDQFNSSLDAKVFFGSIKACGEGISLIGASRILIMDVHLNPSVTRQAIGRAFRPGQAKKVYSYRLVSADTPEEEDHLTAYRKELISKMWFEWSGYFSHHHFDMDEVDLKSCEDVFFESSALVEDVKVLYRR